MNITKENAVEKYCEIIENSWTWDALTPAEKWNWLYIVNGAEIRGTAKQRFDHVRMLYNIYMISCGYSGFMWYDPNENN